jgi:UBX domain-containing protein 1
MIRGLGDFKNDKDEKKKTTSYTGGEKSGMAVENPDNADDIEALVQKAKEGGKEHAKEGGGSTELKITLYSNGFKVGDGEFRPYDAPENQKFMKELKEGYVPEEVRK